MSSSRCGAKTRVASGLPSAPRLCICAADVVAGFEIRPHRRRDHRGRREHHLRRLECSRTERPRTPWFWLKGIKFLDDRIANPAYGVVLLTGLVMIFVGHWSITSLWIIVALVLFAVVVVLAAGLYSPLLRNLIKLVDSGDTSSPEFERLSRRNRILGPAFGLIVLVILAMMVFKPSL